MTRKWILAVAASLGLALAATPLWWDRSSAREVDQEGGVASAGFCDAQAKPAPLDQTLKDIDGKSVHLADFKGKVIFLNFWATWCGPCKLEIPAFVELQEKYRDKGVVFLGLSVDDPVEKLRPFAEQYKMNYPVLVGLGEDAVQESFGPVFGIPATFIIDRKGNVCRQHTGLATKEQFERVIQGLL